MNDLARLQETLFGGGATQVPPNASPVDKFLHVVAHGIDWQAPVGARSSFDFAKELDFDALVVQAPDVLPRYLGHVQNHILDMTTEDADFTSAAGYDDSVVDAISVLERIVAALLRADQPPEVPSAAATELNAHIDGAEERLDDPTDENLEALQDLRSFIATFAESGAAARPHP